MRKTQLTFNSTVDEKHPVYREVTSAQLTLGKLCVQRLQFRKQPALE